MINSIAKQLIVKTLGSLRIGGITLSFPDDTTHVCGEAESASKLHIKFHDWSTVRSTAQKPSLGIGEGYAAKKITFVSGGFEELVHFTEKNYKQLAKWSGSSLAYGLRRASKSKTSQKKHISHHYDVGNDFYKLWLDKSMSYSCAYFHEATDTLEQAQLNKIDHVLRKLQLKEGQSLLDIGSGWGSLLITAAKKYGVSGHGITLSTEQLKHSKAAAKSAGVENLVSFSLMNYQDLPLDGPKYDRIVSIGMFEHVGESGMKKYLKIVNALLRPGGVTVLHTIITQKYRGGTDPWIEKYIFPAGRIPALREICDLLPKEDFCMIDYESLRIHYAMTLDEWLVRFQDNSKKIIDMNGEQLYLTWEMYLATCAANFRAGGIDIAQIMMTKGPNNDLSLTREFMYRP